MTADELDFGPDGAADQRSGAADERGGRSGGWSGATLMTRGLERAGQGDQYDQSGQSGQFGQAGGNPHESGGAGESGGLAEPDGVPDDPAGYALSFARETRVDGEMLGRFRQTAHELGLSRGQAQKLASMYETHAAKAGERAALEREKAARATLARWEEEIAASPTYARDEVAVKTLLRRYGDRELYQLFDHSRLGAHPKVWTFMARVGRLLGESPLHGNGGERPRSAADVLYPNQGK